MREDMAKIIVERPRLNRGWGKKTSRRDKNLDWEELPSKESLKARHSWNLKQLNENLAPLRRFLASSAGRPWDKVFSEICERININSGVQLHIRQHIFDFVAIETFVRDGAIWIRGRSVWRGEMPIEDSRFELYVHPVDGLLKKVVRPPNWVPPYQRRPAPEVVRIDATQDAQFHKIKGIWYCVKLKPVPTDTVWSCVARSCVTPDGAFYDVILQKSFGADHAGPLRSTYGKTGFYGSEMKQLNSKELKAAGLANDPPAV